MLAEGTVTCELDRIVELRVAVSDVRAVVCVLAWVVDGRVVGDVVGGTSGVVGDGVDEVVGPAVEVRMMKLSGLSSCVDPRVVVGGCPGGAGGVTWAGASGGLITGAWTVPVGSGSSEVKSTLPGVRG